MKRSFDPHTATLGRDQRCQNVDYVGKSIDRRAVTNNDRRAQRVTGVVTRGMETLAEGIRLSPWEHAEVGSIMAITINEKGIPRHLFKTERLMYELIKVTKGPHTLETPQTDDFGTFFAAGEEVVEAIPLGPYARGKDSTKEFLKAPASTRTTMNAARCNAEMAARRLGFVDISKRPNDEPPRRLLVPKDNLWVAHVEVEEEVQATHKKVTSWGMMLEDISRRGAEAVRYKVLVGEKVDSPSELVNLAEYSHAMVPCYECGTLGDDDDNPVAIVLCDSCLSGHCTDCADAGAEKKDSYICPQCAGNPLHDGAVEVQWAERHVYWLSGAEHKRILQSKVRSTN